VPARASSFQRGEGESIDVSSAITRIHRRV